MTDSIELPGGSHTDAVDRFAELWWDDASGAAPAAATRQLSTPGPTGQVVIRAERV